MDYCESYNRGLERGRIARMNEWYAEFQFVLKKKTQYVQLRVDFQTFRNFPSYPFHKRKKENHVLVVLQQFPTYSPCSHTSRQHIIKNLF